jgi:hypothetical protein
VGGGGGGGGGGGPPPPPPPHPAAGGGGGGPPPLPVVYVPGNRDYYYGDIVRATEEARRLAESLGVVLLQDDAAEVAGVRFVGATLYTDYALGGDPEAGRAAAAARISDHRVVTLGGEPFTPGLAAALHARSRAFVEGCLASPYGGPTVVVTHHAPHPDCLDSAFAGDPCNGAFASDLSAILEGPDAPELWVHGGTHHPFDRVLGRTRVLSNPRGYAGEIGGFSFDKVVDLAGPVRT